MSADFLHPLVREAFDLHFPRSNAATPVASNGNAMPARCGLCFDTGRAHGGDHPCGCAAGAAGRHTQEPRAAKRGAQEA